MGLVRASQVWSKVSGRVESRMVMMGSTWEPGDILLMLCCSMIPAPGIMIWLVESITVDSFEINIWQILTTACKSWSITRVYTPREACAKPQNVLHSHMCTSCASNYRCTEYFRNASNWWDPHGGSKPSCLAWTKPNNGIYYTTCKTVNRLAHVSCHVSCVMCHV